MTDELFTTPTERIKTSIGVMSYEFNDPTGNPADMEASLRVSILDADGNHMAGHNANNLIPFLTANEKIELIAIFTRLRALAAEKLL